MQFDVYFDRLVQHKTLTEVAKNENKNSTLWLVRVGKLSVSLEILKPERKSNHGKPTESRGRTKPDE
jgi:anti-sigma-K factor RskA